MSRSNTNYYNLCHKWGEIDADGYCDFHRPASKLRGPQHKCIPPHKWVSRRGIEERKLRFPKWTWKSWCSGPPRDVKRAWRRMIRAVYRAEMARRPDDPELFAGEKWLAGQYGWWS